MKLLAISGTVFGSKTSTILKSVLEEVNKLDENIETELLDLRDYNVQFCDGREIAAYSEETRKVIEKVCSADFYVLGTPILHCSFTGALKNLLELIPISAFEHKVIGFVANGGNDQHYLVVEHQLKPIAGYLKAYCAPSYVYVHRDQFDQNNQITDPQVIEQIRQLAKEIVYMQKAFKTCP
jgi:FMN reductase/FAD reductase [NAD(P)H]